MQQPSDLQGAVHKWVTRPLFARALLAVAVGVILAVLVLVIWPVKPQSFPSLWWSMRIESIASPPCAEEPRESHDGGESGAEPRAYESEWTMLHLKVSRKTDQGYSHSWRHYSSYQVGQGSA